jgi:hypothetical protein
MNEGSIFPTLFSFPAIVEGEKSEQIQSIDGWI